MRGKSILKLYVRLKPNARDSMMTGKVGLMHDPTTSRDLRDNHCVPAKVDFRRQRENLSPCAPCPTLSRHKHGFQLAASLLDLSSVNMWQSDKLSALKVSIDRISELII